MATDRNFSNGHWAKNVKTVGEMISELQLLDPHLRVIVGMHSESADLVIFNANHDDAHLSMDDGGEWDYEAADR